MGPAEGPEPRASRSPAAPAEDQARESDCLDLPRYVAIITDGNGRWAKARGLPVNAGHDAGADTVKARLRDGTLVSLPEDGTLPNLDLKPVLSQNTSVVVSLSSTPIRQESPISSCAYTVPAIPAVAITMPTVWTQTTLSILTGSMTPISCRIAALTATISATTKPTPARRSNKPPALMPRNPVEPVRRYCSQLRQPNPSTPNTEKSTTAMSPAAVAGISGLP